MEATFEPNGQATPETRAAILAEYLRLASAQLAPIAFSGIFHRMLINFSAQEEQIAREIDMAHFLLTGAGVLKSNTPGAIGAETMVSPSTGVRHFIWEEFVSAEEGEGY